jgi:hypothetical protein
MVRASFVIVVVRMARAGLRSDADELPPSSSSSPPL